MADVMSAGWDEVNKGVRAVAKKVVDTGKTIIENAPIEGAAIKTGAAVGKAAGEALSEAAARRASDAAAKRVAETTAAGKYGSKGGEIKSIKTSGEATTTSASGAKSTTPNSTKVDIKTPERTPEQRIGDQKRGDTNRQTKISNAAADTYDAVKKTSLAPTAGKAVGALAGAMVGSAPAIAKGTQPDHAVTTVDRKTGRAK